MNRDKEQLTLFRPGTLTAECIEDCIIAFRFAIGASTLPVWLMALILGMTLMGAQG